MSHSNQANQYGFSMLELMVALLIAGLTIVGSALAQNQLSKQALDTTQYSHGLVIANDLIDRMYANPDGLSNYQAQLNAATANIGNFCTAQVANCSGTQCNSTQLARYDVNHVVCKNNVSNYIRINSLAIRCNNAATGATEVCSACFGTNNTSCQQVEVNVTWDNTSILDANGQPTQESINVSTTL